MKFLIALFGLLAIAATGQSVDLTGHKVYRVDFNEADQIRLLYNEMFQSFDRIFWLYVDPEQKFAEIMIAPSDEKLFLSLLEKLSIQYELLYEIEAPGSSNNVARSTHFSYDGYKVYHVNFETEEQFESLRKLQIEGTHDLQVWYLCHKRKDADIMASPEKIAELLDFFKKNDLKYKCVIEDLGELLPNQLNENLKSYKGYKIYEVHFTTEEQYKILVQLKLDSELDYITVLQLSRSRKSADIMASPATIQKLLELLDRYNFTYKCVVEDVGEKSHSRVAKSEDKVSYKGYKVYKVTFETDEQFQFLYKMMLESGVAEGYSFWRLSRADKSADIMVAPTYIPEFSNTMTAHNFGYKVIIDDVEG